LVVNDEVHEYIIVSMFCIFIPNPSYWYSLVFLIVPFCIFVRNIEHKRLLWDMTEYSLLISLLIPIYGGIILRPNSFLRLVFLWMIVCMRGIGKRYITDIDNKRKNVLK